ncbi:Putative Amidohydrolase [[Torrubiella] hemipterigena]|uniref:Putative Amidohydrolase n=1 Tax=[Torrubiella] hemipterigena TaxID=1531966 RepID=A0A0A1T747_9HYPO|nr:Putative Amidohydrolase [[Torrubiella] hemipterigena]
MMAASPLSDLLSKSSIDLPAYEELYKHFHQNPELSDFEAQTAKKVAEELAKLQSFKITTDIGGHGVAAVLENGPGNTILLRSDMDALPVLETTGLPYASKATMADAEGNIKPIMHACGHDMHMTCLLAAAKILIQLKDHWQGTLVLIFQPAEERGTGAQAMVDDGLYTKHNIPVPDFALGQHVVAARAGSVKSRIGPIMAAADSMKITLSGRGGHGSQVSLNQSQLVPY